MTLLCSNNDPNPMLIPSTFNESCLIRIVGIVFSVIIDIKIISQLMLAIDIN